MEVYQHAMASQARCASIRHSWLTRGKGKGERRKEKREKEITRREGRTISSYQNISTVRRLLWEKSKKRCGGEEQVSTSKNRGLFASSCHYQSLFLTGQKERVERKKKKIGGGGKGEPMSTCKNDTGALAVLLSRDPRERRRKAEEGRESKREREREREEEVAGGVPVSTCENITGLLRAHSRTWSQPSMRLRCPLHALPSNSSPPTPKK